MFEKSGKKQPVTPEKTRLQRWGIACLAALSVVAFVNQKSASAEAVNGKDLVEQSREIKQQHLIENSKLEFLKTAPTTEEQEAIAKLRTRLDNISSKRILSTPEIRSNAQITNEGAYGATMSGVEVVESTTNAYFLDNNEHKYYDIITENTTTQINIGVQKNTTKITNELPFTKGYQTTENIVLLEDEQGNYRSLFQHRPGYIKSDGTLDITVNQTEGGQVNKPIQSNFGRDAIVDNKVVEEIRKPGRLSRDFFNQHGYVVQGKTFEEASKLKTNIDRENEESIAITTTNTFKHTHSTENKSTVRESIRSMGYTNNALGEANIGLNILAGGLSSPLKSKLTTAKSQADQRIQNPSLATEKNPKQAVIHSPEVLEELQLEQLILRENIRPSILESRLSALKDQQKGSFIGVEIGTKEVVRATSESELYRTKDSNFNNQFRVGAETDTDNTVTKLEVNNEQPSKDAVAGLYTSFDTQNYSVFNNQTVKTYRQAELIAGINAGFKSGNVVGSSRVAVNHDQLNNVVYPTIQSRIKLGNEKRAIKTEVNYSTNPGINTPNQLTIGAHSKINTGKKSSLTVSGTQTFDLGDNMESYKTRSTLGLSAQLGGKVELSSEYYLGSGNKINENGSLENGKSDKGYLLQTVVRQNWGAVYANISKVNETKKFGVGVVAKIQDNTTAELNYNHQTSYGEFNNSDIVMFKLRKNW